MKLLLRGEGVFNILLGSGAYPLPEKLDRTIYVGVTVDNAEEMRPLSVMAGVPYALSVPDKSITKEKLNLKYVGAISVDGMPITTSGSTLNLKSGFGMSLLFDEKTNSLSLNSIGGIGNATPQSAFKWDEDGNVPSMSGPWLGTKYPGGYYPFEIRVQNLSTSDSGRVILFEGLCNITMGWEGNSIGSNGYNNTIAGGGWYDATLSVDHSNHIGSTELASPLNFIGGGADNDIEGNHNVVGGGWTNTITSAYSAILGGQLNDISVTSGTAPQWSSITGGEDNHITGVSGIEHAFIGGGVTNILTGSNSSILGGAENTVVGDFSSILGGQNNVLTGNHSVILGGEELVLTGNNSIWFHSFNSAFGTFTTTASNAFFLGNVDILIDNNQNSARKLKFFEQSFTGGGNFTSFKAGIMTSDVEYILPITQGAASTFLVNDGSGTLSWNSLPSTATSEDWTITGNSNTDPTTGNFLGTINNKPFEIHVFNSDGTANQGSKRVLRIEPNTTSAIFTGGFQGNTISSTNVGSIICGGGKNGSVNSISSTGGVSATFSLIGGGHGNTITADVFSDPDQGSCIAAGTDNKIIGQLNFIGGGNNNHLRGTGNVLVGGENNNTLTLGGTIPAITNLFIGGGQKNDVQANSASIVGGSDNLITNGGGGSFIGGGGSALLFGITTGHTISSSHSSIVGGCSNTIETECSVIGGGELSLIRSTSTPKNGSHSNIPGGDMLVAQSYAQTVIGYFNKSQGTSTKPKLAADVTTSPTIIGDDRLFIIGNGHAAFGLVPAVASNAFEVTNDGRSQVFKINGNGVASVQGSTYRDNTIEAWGKCLQTGAGVFTNTTFGCVVTKTAVGLYHVIININNPVTDLPMILTDISVAATLYKHSANDGNGCYFIRVEGLVPGTNGFDIRIRGQVVDEECTEIDNSFMFHVTGR